MIKIKKTHNSLGPRRFFYHLKKFTIFHLFDKIQLLKLATRLKNRLPFFLKMQTLS